MSLRKYMTNQPVGWHIFFNSYRELVDLFNKNTRSLSDNNDNECC